MRHRWFIILLPFVVLSFSGWFWSEKKEEAPIVTGVWQSVNLPEPVSLRFSSDWTFKADVESNNKIHITGDYRIVADQIIFDDDMAASEAACRDRAYYYFKITAEKLRLTMIADSCEPRRTILNGYWQLVSSPALDAKKSKKKKS